MIARGPGVIVCAHCRAAGAETSCDVCRRTVCAACAKDWTTCSEPVGVELRLGRAARLRAVDAAGRYGLVSRWRGQMRLLDLHALAWIEAPHWLPAYSAAGPAPLGSGVEPQLTADGRVVYGSYEWREMDGTLAPWFDGLAVEVLDEALAAERGARAGLVAAAPPPKARTLQMCPSGRAAWYLSSDEALYLADLERLAVRRYQPLPGKVLQAAAVDDERALLAAATWGEVALYRIEDDRLRPLGTARVDGDVTWIGLADEAVAAISSSGFRSVVLTVFDLGPGGGPGDEVLQVTEGISCGPADLRADGQLLAIASGRDRVRLIDLEAGTTTDLRGHSDGVNLVAFVAGGSTLITADHDNRVILRPRAGASYAAAVRRASLSRAVE